MSFVSQQLTQWRTAVEQSIPKRTRDTLALNAFGLTKIPMLLLCLPQVQRCDEQVSVVRIDLNWRTRNHLKSMYIGALVVGADCAAGFLAMDLVRQRGKKVSIVFKALQADFLKRVNKNVYFRCEDGLLITQMVDETIATGERVNGTVNIAASYTAAGTDEAVARFALTLSLKFLGDKA